MYCPNRLELVLERLLPCESHWDRIEQSSKHKQAIPSWSFLHVRKLCVYNSTRALCIMHLLHFVCSSHSSPSLASVLLTPDLWSNIFYALLPIVFIHNSVPNLDWPHGKWSGTQWRAKSVFGNIRPPDQRSWCHGNHVSLLINSLTFDYFTPYPIDGEHSWAQTLRHSRDHRGRDRRWQDVACTHAVRHVEHGVQPQAAHRRLWHVGRHAWSSQRWAIRGWVTIFNIRQYSSNSHVYFDKISVFEQWWQAHRNEKRQSQEIVG